MKPKAHPKEWDQENLNAMDRVVKTGKIGKFALFLKLQQQSERHPLPNPKPCLLVAIATPVPSILKLFVAVAIEAAVGPQPNEDGGRRWELEALKASLSVLVRREGYQ